MTATPRAEGNANGAPQAPPQPVPLAPVPTHMNVRVVPVPDGQLVALEVTTPVGVSVYFLDPRAAAALADVIAQASAFARSNIVIAPAGSVRPLAKEP